MVWILDKEDYPEDHAYTAEDQPTTPRAWKRYVKDSSAHPVDGRLRSWGFANGDESDNVVWRRSHSQVGALGAIDWCME